MQKTTDVFISYSSLEYQRAQALRDILEANGISCWMAPQSIPAGSDYTRAIPEGIKGAKVFLLVLSDHAQQSKWVTAEVESAFENRKIIIPYAIENCDISTEFGFMIAKTDRIDGYRHRTSSLEQLIRTINNALGRTESEKQKINLNRRHKIRRAVLAAVAVLLVAAAVIGGFLLGGKARRDKKTSGTGAVTDDSGDSVGEISWKFDPETKLLTVSGSGRMEDYSYDNQPPWMTVCENEEHGVIDIMVEEGITEIGDYAFRGLYAKSISLPDTLVRLGELSLAFNRFEDLQLPDSLKTLGESALQNIDIHSLTVPEGVNEVYDECFAGCDALESLRLPSTMSIMGNNLFEGCDKLQEIIIPDDNPDFIILGDAIYTKDLYALRYYLGDEESYTVPEGIQKISDYAFAHKKIRSVSLPQGLTGIGSYAFAYCRELTDISLPDSITYLGENAFSSCNKLEQIEIPPLVTEIPSAAFMGTAIREAVVPDGVTKLGSNAFSNCDRLAVITIPASVTEIDDIFFMDKNPKTVIRCVKGSEAEMYALNGNSEGITYQVEYIE